LPIIRRNLAPPHPATTSAMAGVFEACLLVATAASIWVAVLAVLEFAVLDAIK